MRDLTAGEAVKAMVLNGLGFINQALYLKYVRDTCSCRAQHEHVSRTYPCMTFLLSGRGVGRQDARTSVGMAAYRVDLGVCAFREALGRGYEMVISV
jgi:hypothetical protein